jgi:hypothetical protein
MTSVTEKALLSSFLETLDLRLYHYFGFITCCLAQATNGLLFAVYGDECPSGISLGLSLAGFIGLSLFLIRYVRVYSRLPKDGPIRNRLPLSLMGFLYAVVPPRTLREYHPWLMPLWAFSLAAWLVGIVAVVLRVGQFA